MRQHPTRPPAPTWLALIVVFGLWNPAAASEPAAEEEPAPAFRGPRDLPESARDAWAATVFVETRSWRRGTGGDRDLVTGSGVMLAQVPEDGTVVIATSAHVVPCEALCLIRVVFPAHRSRERAAPVRARLLWRDGRQDLALLRAPPPAAGDLRIARPAADPARVAGGRVLAIGFPDPDLGVAGPASGRAKLFSSGRMLAARDGFRAGYRAFASTAVGGQLAPEAALFHTAELLPGSSGGPLIDADGAVLGINTGSLAAVRGTGCVEAATADGERCLHLAVALDAALAELASHLATAPRASSRAATN